MTRIALLLFVALSTGCAEALFSLESYRTHDAYNEASLREFGEVRGEGPVTKAEVLATLGPPIDVIGQDTGEIYIYRRLARDTRTLNLNPAMVNFFISLPPVPLFFASRTSGRNDTLMLFFDAQGRTRGESFNLGIKDTGRGGEVFVGEGVQELIE